MYVKDKPLKKTGDVKVCNLTGVEHITAIHSHRSGVESEISFHLSNSQILRVCPAAIRNLAQLQCVNNAMSLQQGFFQWE